MRSEHDLMRKARRCVRRRRCAVIALAAAASVSCTQPIRVAPRPSVEPDRLESIELVDGTKLVFDGDGARVSADSVVGRVAGVRTAVPLRDVNTLDIHAPPATNTPWVWLIIGVAALGAVTVILMGGAGHAGGF
jgi:hypothetical protein